MTTICQAEGCDKPVSRAGFELCYSCWKRRDQLRKVEGCWVPVGAKAAQVPLSGRAGTAGDSLSSTKIGKAIGLSNQRVNLLLAEIGWIEKFVKGWKVTRLGETAGGMTKTSQKGVPYVVWPSSVLENRVFLESTSGISEPTSEDAPARFEVDSAGPAVEDGRLKYPAKYRAADGHYVRSRAELSIDNWLYMQGIVHAYERKLPIEEDAYCDFYLPEKKVFIEYWGMEKDPRYAARKTEKTALYAKHGLNLVELADAELENLDDNLARFLIRYGVACT